MILKPQKILPSDRPQIVPAPIDHFAEIANMLDNVDKLVPPARLERATHGLGIHPADDATD